MSRGRSSILKHAGALGFEGGGGTPPGSSGHGGGVHLTSSTPVAGRVGTAPLVFCSQQPSINSREDSASIVIGPQISDADALDNCGGAVGSSVAHSASAQHEDIAYGLTPASLKHLRRQRDKLEEEKTRLTAELTHYQAQCKEARERTAVLEQEAIEHEALRQSLQTQVLEACERTEQERHRADELMKLNATLEEARRRLDADLADARARFEEQRLLTREVCEAASRRGDGGAEAARTQIKSLEDRCSAVDSERDFAQREVARLKQQLSQQATDHAMAQKTASQAVASAEKAMQTFAGQAKQIEQLRISKLADAINQKVELHISVPRVTLSYNNAPPLMVSSAAGIFEGRMRDFLEREVFPHFEPLWVRMDDLDQAPDGSSKRTYCTRMLERLTEAIKGFVLKSQLSDVPPGCDKSLLLVEAQRTGALPPEFLGSPAAGLAGLNSALSARSEMIKALQEVGQRAASANNASNLTAGSTALDRLSAFASAASVAHRAPSGKSAIGKTQTM